VRPCPKRKGLFSVNSESVRESKGREGIVILNGDRRGGRGGARTGGEKALRDRLGRGGGGEHHSGGKGAGRKEGKGVRPLGDSQQQQLISRRVSSPASCPKEAFTRRETRWCEDKSLV